MEAVLTAFQVPHRRRNGLRGASDRAAWVLRYGQDPRVVPEDDE